MSINWKIIAMKRRCPEAWFDYGVHLMLEKNTEKVLESCPCLFEYSIDFMIG